MQVATTNKLEGMGESIRSSSHMKNVELRVAAPKPVKSSCTCSNSQAVLAIMTDTRMLGKQPFKSCRSHMPPNLQKKKSALLVVSEACDRALDNMMACA